MSDRRSRLARRAGGRRGEARKSANLNNEKTDVGTENVRLTQYGDDDYTMLPIRRPERPT